jgi:hypothetical protein
MPRLVFALVLCCLTLHGAASAYAGAKTKGDEMSRCLDASTTIEAGGDVGDKELMAAQQACASVKQTSKDSHTIARINAADANLTAEAERRNLRH